MLENNVPTLYNVTLATADKATFVCMFYTQNIDALHGREIPLNQWKEILSKDDPDEKNFLIYKNEMPVAWLRVNGLMNNDIAWISMLVVSDRNHHQGIGNYAVAYAEH